MDSPSSSPKLKRAARTYGRPRQYNTTAALADPDHDPLLVDSPYPDTTASLSSNNNSPALSISHNDYPPSSDDADLCDTSYNDDHDADSHGRRADDKSDSDDDMQNSIPKLRYYHRRSIKEDLALIDQEFDEDAQHSTQAARDKGDRAKSALWSKNLGREMQMITDDPFEGPSTTALAASSSRQSEGPLIDDNGSPQSSPVPAKKVRRRLLRVADDTLDNDSEEPQPQPAQTSPLTSPGVLHPINTPEHRSSPTPPTSQEMSPRSGKGKGKGKAKSSERSQSAEDSDDLPSLATTTARGKTRGTRKSTKEKRVKAPSKKERLETQKAQARIIADQRPELPRHDKKLKISSFLGKLRNVMQSQQPSVAHNDEVTLPSDPIDTFSSPSVPHVTTPFHPTITKPLPLQIEDSRSRSRSKSTEPKSQTTRGFVATGLLGGIHNDDELYDEDVTPETPSRSKPQLASKSKPREGDVFTSNGLLDTAALSDSDEELPDMQALIAAEDKNRENAGKQQRLRAMKMQALQRQQQAQALAEDGEIEGADSDLEVVYDDMHVVAEEEEKDRRVRKKESVGRQKQLAFAAVRSPNKHKASPLRPGAGGPRDLTVLAAAAVPAFAVREGKGKARERDAARVNPNELNRLLLNASEKQSRALAKQKEEEFNRRMGKHGSDVHMAEQGEQINVMDRFRTLVDQGLEKRMQMSDEGDDDEADGGESDGEWTPNREGRKDETDGEEQDETIPAQISDPGEPDEEENDENEDIHVKARRPLASTRGRAILDSDSEEGENHDENSPSGPHSHLQPRSFGRVLVAHSSLVLASTPPSDTPANELSPGLNHRGSMSSMSERLEDGTDKENDMRLMFDRSEDKENTAVPVLSQTSSFILSPPGSQRGGITSRLGGTSSFSRTTSSSSGGAADITLLGDENVRKPLKELSGGLDEDDDDADFFLSPSQKLQLSLARSRGRGDRRTSVDASLMLESQSLSPLRLKGSQGKGIGAFFSDDEDDRPNLKASPEASDGENMPCSLEPAAVIRSGPASQGGLSQFFEASLREKGVASPKPVKPLGGLSQLFSPERASSTAASPHGRPNAMQDLSLTLGPSLRPALEVDENVLRKADEIFQKEQEFVVGENVATNNAASKSELFINEHGFYTQTRPTGPTWGISSPTSPLFNQSSPAFTPAGGSSAQRQPLGTLSLTKMDDEGSEEENMRPRRLRKRSTTPEEFGGGGYRSSPSPSPVKRRNAFELLGKKPYERIKAPQFLQVNDKAKGKGKQRMERNEFIEGEAEESDEDAGFGFGALRKKDDGDEEDLDGEDQDGVLEELVDDAAMDENTLNEERVLEKVQEHRAIDDAADEKIARDAAEGKMRVKRRNNLLDFDDDESDDEDYAARNARERMAKKRRIEGDTLEAIEKNPETRAFAAAYHVEDDDDDFAHLEQEDDLTLIGGIENDVPDEDDADDEEEEQEVVDAVQLRQQLQRVARGEETVKTIDVNDVDWVDRDEDDMDEDVQIKEVDTAFKKPAPRLPSTSQMEWDLIQQPQQAPSTQDIARQQKWARSEGGSRNLGTGRASAVTGIGKSSKVGGGTIANRRKGTAMGESSSTQGTTKQAARLAKAPSALSAAVSGRRAKFGN